MTNCNDYFGSHLDPTGGLIRRPKSWPTILSPPFEDHDRFGEAIKVQLKLVASYEADPEDSADDLANAYEDLARLYANSDQFTQSRRAYEQAVKLFGDLYGSDDEDLLRCKQGLGVLYRNHGRPKDGIGLLEDVVSAYRTQQEPSDLASALMALGSNVYLAGDRVVGFKLLEESLGIRRAFVETRTSVVAMWRPWNVWWSFTRSQTWEPWLRI